MVSVALLGSSYAQNQDQKKSNTDLSKAKDTVDRIREPDPPKVSTETKKTPPTTQPKPKPPKKEPPPPSK